ncbi:type 1 glutamine amidotransferase domain-containing protein [Legionella impletisoli]|uniref:Protease n=1 Tax=Legionella impletisoli TaxID=343510 RepID=A0A917JMI5_9GAMM|nr:type 1 glutamine amidotransferase domain-containing protein [Legionella impletisoli]GGI76876.1 protease [Legionella impletisoli]
MNLEDKSVGILIENDYQELEFWYPYLRLQEAGVSPLIIGQDKTTYKSKLGYEVESDVAAKEVEEQLFDAIIIPGGYAPDKMRTHKAMVNLVRSNYKKGKIIAAICHASWMLVSASILSDKKVTCYHSIKDDVINAGAHYLDEPVVVDQNLITSRQPFDLPYFCKAILEALSKQ